MANPYYHPTYARAPYLHEAFTGARSELRGGEYLGRSARPDLARPGDIIAVDDARYYFDPALLIDGPHFIRSESKRPGSAWLRLGFDQPRLDEEDEDE